MAKYHNYRTTDGTEISLCEACASRRIDAGELLQDFGLGTYREGWSLGSFGQCDDCGHAARFDIPSNFVMGIYELDGAMTEVELGSPEEVGERLLNIIREAGFVTKADAIRIVWNEFGGKYIFQNPEGTRSIRRDVMRAMKKRGGNSYRFLTNPMRWEKQNPS